MPVRLAARSRVPEAGTTAVPESDPPQPTQTATSTNREKVMEKALVLLVWGIVSLMSNLGQSLETHRFVSYLGTNTTAPLSPFGTTCSDVFVQLNMIEKVGELQIHLIVPISNRLDCTDLYQSRPFIL